MANETCVQETGSFQCEEQTRIYMERPQDMLDPHAINPTFVPIILTHAVTFLVGVVGNSIVIVTWAGSRPSRSPTCTFLVSLAVADLLLLLIYVPLETLGYFVITWDAGGATCKLSSYIEMLSGMASVLNLTAVSFERFLVIAFPIMARRFCTISTCRRGLLAVWVLALALAAPVLVTKRIHPITYYNNATSITVYYCWDNTDNLAFCVAVYQLIAIFALPALFMSVCYFWVIRELWSSTKTIAAMTRPNSDCRESSTSCCRQPHIIRFTANRQQQQQRAASRACSIHRQGIEIQQARKQVIKMLVLVIILFMVCWGPRLVMNVAIKHGLHNFTYSVYSARVSFYLLSFIHSALNPFVYGFMSSNFRRMMLQSCSEDMVNLLHCGRVEARSQTRRQLSDSYEFSTCATSVRRSRPANSIDINDKQMRKSQNEWSAV